MGKKSSAIIEQVKTINLTLYNAIGSIQRAMLDSSNMLVNNLKNEICIESKIGGEIAGYAIFQQKKQEE
jgi:hypothetical protein